MKIYVAASSRECDRAERIMNEIRAAGHAISHDWIPSVREAIASGIDEAKLDDERAFAAALADMNGAISCDALVFLAPTNTSKMAWAELGGALARGIPVVVAHDDPERRVQSIVLRLAHASVADADVCRAIGEVLYLGRRA